MPELEPGMVFDPTDEELVSYLVKKASSASEGERFDFIKYIELYQHEPSELRRLAQDSGHEKWYFFTLLQKKYQQGRNINRQVPGGFWQKTGSPSIIRNEAGDIIAKKTSLTYYKKDQTSDQSEKTNWLMKEYMLVKNQTLDNPNDEESEMLTLCYIHRSKHHRRTTNRRRSSDVND